MFHTQDRTQWTSNGPAPQINNSLRFLFTDPRHRRRSDGDKYISLRSKFYTESAPHQLMTEGKHKRSLLLEGADSKLNVTKIYEMRFLHKNVLASKRMIYLCCIVALVQVRRRRGFVQPKLSREQIPPSFPRPIPTASQLPLQDANPRPRICPPLAFHDTRVPKSPRHRVLFENCFWKGVLLLFFRFGCQVQSDTLPSHGERGYRNAFSSGSRHAAGFTGEVGR